MISVFKTHGNKRSRASIKLFTIDGVEWQIIAKNVLPKNFVT